MPMYRKLRERFAVTLSIVLLSIGSTPASGAGQAPSMPEDLQGSVTDGTVSLSWSASSDADDQVKGYNVYRNNRYLSTVSGTSYTGSVDIDTLYSFYVVAFDTAPSKFSTRSEAISLPDSLVPDDTTIPPSVPENLSGSIDGTSVSLSWDPSTDDEAVQGYNVYRDNRYVGTRSSPSYTGSVVEGESYSFHVVAFDVRTNFSAASAKLRLPEDETADPSSPPSVPVALSGTVTANQSTDTVTLTWQDSTDNIAVRGYNVYRNNRYVGTRSSPSYTGTVPAGSSNVFAVVAFDDDDNFSAISEGLTLPEPDGSIDLLEPPSAPTQLAAVLNDAKDFVTLSWQPSTDNTGVAGYNVYRNNAYLTTVSGPSWSGAVEPGAFDNFYIVAFDVHRNFSARSRPIDVPEDDRIDERPSTPTGLAGSIDRNAEGSIATLSWNASTDDRRVNGYNVYENNRYRTTVAGTSWQGRVVDGEPYSYYIVAFDSGGNYSRASDRLALLGSENQAPVFANLGDRTTRVGELWEQILRPVDVDGGAPGVLVGDLPGGMSSSDNRDGTYTLRWSPPLDAVGDHAITVTAIDAVDPSLRTETTFTLTVLPDDGSGAPPFSLVITDGTFNLREGDAAGVDVPFSVVRSPGFDEEIALSVEAVGAGDGVSVTSTFAEPTLAAERDESLVNLRLDIGALPILAQQRSFRIVGTANGASESTTVTTIVTPVQRDDVYLLIGQSNMVGASAAGAKQSGPGQPDEPVARIRQLNVSPNDIAAFADPSDWTDVGANVRPPSFVTAEDPLHEPVDPGTLTKSGSTIGPGLSFAKAALDYTSRNVILVPAAWSGSGFCDVANFAAEWNGVPPSDPALGTTLLFDRALLRVEQALQQSGGIFRGILWLQGEADARPGCAESYRTNLETLVAELRTRVIEDARGGIARAPEANVPFVVGTLSRGVDERGNYSVFSAAKTLVDEAHKSIASYVPHAEVSLHDDLVPANGYPCGNGDCVHFGAEAYREIGARFHDALLRAAAGD